MTIRERALALLVKCISEARSSEFMETFWMEVSTKEFITQTANHYDEYREYANENGMEIPQFANTGRPITFDKVMAFWEGYFEERPTHGEIAGWVCQALYRMDKWNELYSLLTLIQRSAGEEEFIFDS